MKSCAIFVSGNTQLHKNKIFEQLYKIYNINRGFHES